MSAYLPSQQSPNSDSTRINPLVKPEKKIDRLFTGWIIVITFLIYAQSGCVSPLAINRAVLAYDQSVTKAENELLLINLLRMRDEEPPHFSIMSSIAATFDFRVRGGLIGQALHDDFFGVNLGSEAAENPTATIIPVQGEEFTRRVLLPLDHARFEFLAHQPYHLSSLLRMAVREVEMADETVGQRVIVNSPGYREDYQEFRRLVLHLTYLYSTHRLYIGPIVYEERIDLSDNILDLGAIIERSLERGDRFEKKQDGSGYLMTRIVHGRTVITNYPLGSLRNEEKRDWDLKVRRLRINEIPIDIKADSPGGDYPAQAILRLRGLYETMRFLAKGLGPEVEYQVDPDPRTGIIAEQLAAAEINPAGTLLLHSGDSPPSNAFVSTKHKGSYYWLTYAEQSPIPLESWNRGAFAMLHTMYQLSVSEAVTKTPAPAITIAK